MNLGATFLTLCIAAGTASVNSNAQMPASTNPTQVGSAMSFDRITAAELALVLADLSETNPSVLQRIKEDPELKQKQLDNLRELLAFAAQAQKEGLAENPIYRTELQNIGDEVAAVEYDRFMAKGLTSHTRFSRVSKAQIDSYWNGSSQPGQSKADREKRFEEFLQAKFAILKENDPDQREREITDPEKQEARDFYAKIRISVDGYASSKSVPKIERDKVDLKIKLQRAQFLARLYSAKVASQIVVSDADIAAYTKSHSEFDTASQRRKAEELLARAKAGDDFAALANEFSEDPGNRNEQDQPQGGLYRNVKHEVMVAPFEIAALTLEPGQVYPEVVESTFGFHVIKLERKGKAVATNPTDSYDVRHILISTSMPNPDDPTGRLIPLKEYIRNEVENEKEREIIERLVAANHISVPDDFVIPAARPVTPPAKTARPKSRPARKHD